MPPPSNRNIPQASQQDKQATQDFLDAMNQSSQAVDDLDQRFLNMEGTIRNIGTELKDTFANQVRNANKETKDYAKSLDGVLGKLAKESSKFAAVLDKNQKNLFKATNIESQRLDVERRRESIIDTINEAAARGYALDQRKLDAARSLILELDNQLVVLNKQKNQAEAVKERFEMIGSLMQGLTKIPIVGQFINAQRVMEKVKKTAEEGGSKWKQLGVGILETFAGIGKALANPSMLISSFFGLLYKVFMMAINLNKKFFETAKILGTSVDEASKLYSKFQGMAPLGLRAKEVAQAYAAASDSLGFMASTGSDFAITMAGLQKNVGASAEHMAALATQSALSGKGINASFISMVGTAKAAGAQNKLALTTRQILDKIAKVSSAVLINFKGNIPALATAVVKATKLGTSLEQVNKQAEALLDFETSIQNQFEAEALTGEQLNLDRARGLALAGDTAGVMKELNAQGMTMEKFSSMNVIQREAFAKAIGLSNEEFSKQLIMQKQAEALGAKEGESLQKRYETLRKQGVTHEQIVARIGAAEAGSLRQQSLADKWQAILEKIQDTLGRIVMGPVTEIVNKVVAFLNNTKAIEAVGLKIKKVYEFISSILSNIPKILANAVAVSKILVSLSVARAVATVAASAGATPVVGLAAALAAGAAMYMYLGSLAKDAGLDNLGAMSGGGAPTGAVNTSDSVRPMNTTAATAAANNNNRSPNSNKPIVVHSTLKVNDKEVASAAGQGYYTSGYGVGTSWDNNTREATA